jgi:MFS family permease
VALALLALCPFIVLTTAFGLLTDDLVRDLGTTEFGVGLVGGLANAAYAFGAVLSADLIRRVPSRYIYLACQALFIVGSLLALVAGDVYVFAAGRVLQGLVTGMLLVAALPPLVTGNGAEKLPMTAAVINLGLFGMVTLGPAVGGVAADADAWRALLAAGAVLGTVGLVIGSRSFERRDPVAGGPAIDRVAIPLALGATVLPFVGSAWLVKGGFGSPGFWLPISVGLVLVVVLVVVELRKPDALMPVRPISHTLPVTGTLAAMVAGAAFTTLLELAQVLLLDLAERPPGEVGALLATQVAGVAVAAWLFKRLLPTRHLPALALSGLVSVVVAAGVLLALTPANSGWLTPLVAVLLGYGAGAGVAPGLFLAGFSVPATQLGPTFALVELLRSEAAFLVGPVLVHAAVSGDDLTAGLHLAIAVTLGVTVLGGLAALAVYLAGGARPHAPDLQAWLDGDRAAYHSPRLGHHVRGPAGRARARRLALRLLD